MKRTERCLSILLILSVAGMSAEAQEYVEAETFQKSASDNSLLFRARQALRYNMSYDGTYYWYSPDFEVGGVMYDGRWYDDVTLNVDAFGKQLVAIPSPGRPAVELDRDHIDFFTMGETRFVNLRKKGYDVPVGFYEVAYEGPFTLYRVVNKKITSDYSGAGMTAGYAIDSFDTTESYYIEKDGSIAPVRKRKARRFLLNPSAGRDPGTSALASKKAVALSPAVSKTGPELRIPTVDIPSVPLPDPAAGDFKIGDKTVYASLPPGFFSDGKDKAVDDELLRLINAANEMVTFANKVYQIGQPENARGDHAYVNGTVRDILSGEPITGVAVFDDKTGPWIPSGYMGNTRALKVDEACTESPFRGSTCMRIDYLDHIGWAGIFWQNPANDWGEKPGGVNLSKATTLVFRARGLRGGEKVTFFMGGLKDKAFNDTAEARLPDVILKKEWTVLHRTSSISKMLRCS